MYRQRLGLLVTLAVVLVLGVHPAPGQRLEDGQNIFEDKIRLTRILRGQLYKGEIRADPNNKEHLEAISHSAMETVYPLKWKTETRFFEPGSINSIVDTFDSRLFQMAKFKANTEVMQVLYCKQVIEKASEVIQKSKPIAGVNAARILALISERRMERGVLQSYKDWTSNVLPRLADGNGELLADTCLKLLENKDTPDGTRYYLFKALYGVLAMMPANPKMVTPKTIERAAQVAIAQIEKPLVYTKSTPPPELEGYKILRAQAMAVLGQTRISSSSEGKDKGVFVVAKVLGADTSLTPAPRIDERLEALVALGIIAPSAEKAGIQMDYVMSLVVRFVQEFAIAANANLAETKPLNRLRPWKVEAARMLEALDQIKAANKNSYVQEAVRECQKILLPIEGNNTAPAGELGDWLARTPPPNKTVFKDDPKTVVNVPDAIPAGEGK